MNPHKVINLSSLFKKFIIVFCLLAYSHSIHAELEKKWYQTEKGIALDLITKQRGQIISTSKYAQLTNALTVILNDISREYNKMHGEKSNIGFELFYIKSEVPNAFVSQINRKVLGKKNLIFLNEGLIQELLYFSKPDQVTAEQIQERIDEIAGVIAHEMAHPIDFSDNEGFLKKYGRDLSSQIREIRADLEGAELLRRAGYPMDSTLKVTRRLGRLNKKSLESASRSVVEMAQKSTHPYDPVRESAQRMGITLLRRTRGESVSPKKVRNIEGLKKEVQSMYAHLDNLVPDRLDEHMALIEKYISILDKSKNLADDKIRNTVLEFNQLIIAYAVRLKEKRLNFYDREIEKIVQLNKKINEKRGYIIPYEKKGAYQYRQLFRDYNAPTYIEAIQSVPIFSDQRYLSRVPIGRAHDFYSLVRDLEYMLPEEHVFEQVLKLSKSIFVTKSDKNNFSNVNYLFQDIVLPVHSKPKRIAELVSRAHEALSTGALSTPNLFFHFSSDKGNALDLYHSLMLFEVPIHISPRDNEKLKEIQNYILSQSSDLRKSFEDTAKMVWENRADIALSELTSTGGYERDWNFIFKLLGKDPQDGKQEILSAVKSKLNSTDVWQILKNAIYEHEIQQIFTGSKLITDESKIKNLVDKKLLRKPIWADKSLIPFLSGDKLDLTKYNNDQITVIRGKMVEDLLLPYLYKDEDALKEIRQIKLKENEKDEFAYLLKNIEEIKGLHDLVTPDVIIEEISAAHLTDGQKKTLLEKYFADLFSGQDAIRKISKEHIRAIVESFIKYKIVDTPSIALEKFANTIESHTIIFQNIFDLLLKEAKNLKIESHSVQQDADQIANYLSKVFSVNKTASSKSKSLSSFWLKSKEVKILQKELIEKINKLLTLVSLSLDYKFTLFTRITYPGASEETDDFFKKFITVDGSVELTGVKNPYEFWPAFLGSHIFDPRLKVDITKKLLEFRINEIKSLENINSPSVNAKANELLDLIKKLLPSAHSDKDKFLEDLVWDLQLNDEKLVKQFENEKSINWKNADPVLINYASALGAVVEPLSLEQ